MNSWRIALLYNLKHPALAGPDAPADAQENYDSPETIRTVELALRAAGHEVFSLEADHTLLDTIRDVNPDLCFNMAKGMNGKEREAQVPALLEMLNIPYTGSGVLGHALAQDKAAAKRTWQEAGLPTAAYQVMLHPDDALSSLLTFPLFVKPVHEGSGVGIGPNARVENGDQLRRRVAWIVDTYQQPALVESYLPGREFSVVVLGNAGTKTTQSRTGHNVQVLPILEIDNPTFTAADRRYICPASNEDELRRTLARLAVDAFTAVGALDVARVDIRLDRTGSPMLLEIDVLPNLDPARSRSVAMARAAGMSYEQFIARITGYALERHFLTDTAEMSNSVTASTSAAADNATPVSAY